MPEEYFKVDVHICDHPKVVDLSDAAFRVFFASIGYANRLMTDGFIARAVVRRLHDCDPYGDNQDTLEVHAAELVEAGLWEVVEGGWQIHSDYLDCEIDRRALMERVRAMTPEGLCGQWDCGGLPAGRVNGAILYRFRDGAGALLYVGITQNPVQRWLATHAKRHGGPT
jgi:hypothetical protein